MGHALPSLFRVQIFVTATSIAVIFDFFSIAPDALSRLTGELLAVIGVLNGTDPCLRHGVIILKHSAVLLSQGKH